MAPAVALFLFGLLAGFVLTRLRRGARIGGREREMVERMGWAVMAMAATLGVALLAWLIIAAA